MKIVKDIDQVRMALDTIEQNMRQRVQGAERRLGLTKVVQAFRLLQAAQAALQDLAVLVHPAKPVVETTAEALMAQGYM